MVVPVGAAAGSGACSTGRQVGKALLQEVVVLVVVVVVVVIVMLHFFNVWGSPPNN